MEKKHENVGDDVPRKCDLMFEFAGVPQEKVLAMYLRGSRGIGTHNPDSDYDFVVVLENDIPLGQLRYHHQDIDYTLLEE